MIRKLKDKDIDKVMNIWLESTIKAHDFISKEYWESNYDTVKEVYIPIADSFIYEEKGIIKGFISVIDKEFIGALFVDNNYQGLGIGSKLIRYVDSIYDELTLTVYKENSRAVNFYKSIGFNILDEQINDDTGSIEYYMKK